MVRSANIFIGLCFVLTLFRDVVCAIPPYIKICNRHDPKINDCILDSINQLHEKLAIGIPELDVPPLEPFKLNEIRLLRGPNAAKLDVNLTDLQVWGASKFVLSDLTTNVDDVIFTFRLHFPVLTFNGKYQIDSKLLLLHLSGDGDLDGSFNDYDSNIVLKGQKIRRNDKIYVQFEKMKIKIKIGNANVYLKNLFNGDPVLGKISNDVIKSNSGLLIDEIKPELEKSLSTVLTNIANKVVEAFTYDELFPVN
ncbi:PREDICTED: uncharacterized protein LOC107065267 [Polistes dominula]|uniref:Uncharacterized protein LOC107065267 n=1 Tax=Polistes dominula TaxID=743375 RepID=A0ABM1I246_POLDO|nr:PREDICTED: uncharacterized protein LOC107065267 [Polistes dominula]